MQRFATAQKLADEDFLTVWSDGTKPLKEIASLPQTKLGRTTIMKCFHSTGALTDYGKDAVSLLSQELQERIASAVADRERTLSKQFRRRVKSEASGSSMQASTTSRTTLPSPGLTNSEASSSNKRRLATAMKLVDEEFLAALSDGSKYLEEVAKSVPSVHPTTITRNLWADGSLRAYGEATLSLLSPQQRQRFDLAAAQRQRTLTDKIRKGMRSGVASRGGNPPSVQDDLLSELLGSAQLQAAGGSQASGGRFSSPSPSLFQGLTPYQNPPTPSHESRTPSGRTEIPDYLISPHGSAQSSDRSVAARRSAHSTPGSSRFFDDLTTPGSAFALSEPSRAFGSHSAVTEAELELARSEISAEIVRSVAQGLSQRGHVHSLDDLEAYSGAPAASMRRLAREVASGDSTSLQLTPLGEEFVRRYGSGEDRYRLFGHY